MKKLIALSLVLIFLASSAFALGGTSGTGSGTSLTGSSGGGSPTGAAGGDLSGTYPNPTVVNINGTAVTTSITSPLHIGGTGTTSTITFQPTSGAGTTGADIIFKNGNNGATEVARILNSGSVGIGTNAVASAKLAVNGSMAVGTYAASNTAPPSNGMLISGKVGIGTSNPVIDFQVTASSSGGGIIINGESTNNPQLGFNNAGFTRMQYGYALSSSAFSNIAASGDVVMASGNTSGGRIIIANRNSGAGSIILSTGTTDSAKVTILTGGNVGIGTATPLTTLDTNGPIKTQGYAIASLPAGVVGMRAYVTDQLTTCPVLDGTFTAGGSVICSAFYNGTAWVHD